jgi:hypothetical protein
MGILDEAIKEHLELKRQHGADDSELKQLEDQAFGPPERPGSEEPSAPEAGGVASAAAAEAPTEFMTQPGGEKPPVRREPAAGIADIQEPPEKPAEPEPAAEEAAAEEPSATEHEAIPSAPVEHSTEERHAIADQPTQMYDVEEELAATDAPAPPDEDLVAEEMSEARLGPVEPLPPAPQLPDEDEEDDFFDEQRLSEELDQALEAPGEPEPPETPAESEPESEPAPQAAADEHDAAAADEDVLEETPEFLEETPEDDQLWFEQKPPKDFDFDD